MASIDTPDDDRFGDVEDVVTWQMRFSSGNTAVWSTSYSAAANRLGVAGTDGYLELQPATDYYEQSFRPYRGHERGRRRGNPSQFARMLDHLSEAVLNGTAVDRPGEEGMQDIHLLRAIYEAAESGSPVTVDWEYGQAG